ncbi:MAG TPA: cobalamin-binding protein [Firmicutes bacterium]|nr:cobalamin-binding protein [Bacillota bacterium]
MSLLLEISGKLQIGKAEEVKNLVQEALDAGFKPIEVLEDGLLSGMNIIGEKFKNNEVYVPEVLIAARAMNFGMETLKPYLVEADVKEKGTAVLGTVKGDLHDIGKNMVRMMMEGKGIKVIDLGVDVPAEKFVAAANEHKADLICCSALLTTTMMEMKNVVAAVEKEGLRARVKIMVGGAPVTQSFCDRIGADLYAGDATSAAEVALATLK